MRILEPPASSALAGRWCWSWCADLGCALHRDLLERLWCLGLFGHSGRVAHFGLARATTDNSSKLY